ncbi:extracellular solute-binding protein [uncultured Cohaesibacter sp.]|uniref:ABC transporter substrate-binding protein n=1 Tax=uncultured Cohaesibacter sp. TaxID=1002546 RepID=UPI0029C7A234|nr:extracellular solute-binding protein [uncultured Cohaesibacter sp.]
MKFCERLGGIALCACLVSSTALAGELVLNSDQSDPAPKKAMEELIADFEAANPDIKVKWNNFDHEGYKSAIRNFLSADAPDVAAWYAGNRMDPFVKAGLFEDITDVWDENGLNEQLHSAAASMTIDGKKWGVPYTYYQWGIYYNKDAYKKAGVEVPKTWDEFIAACGKFEAAGIDCLTTGTKYLWPGAGIFDYINLRTNGYEFHMDLTAGKVAWTDDRVKATFDNWAKIVPYTTKNHAALDWQEAATLLVQGKAANYVMGNFAVATFKQGGMTNDNLGFMLFPEITPGIPRAEEAPTDTFHIPSGAKNKADAKKFLAYLASADAQTKMNITLGQLPVNNQSHADDDPFLKSGFEALSNAYALAQFFDRDAPADMAKAGMEAFQEFMTKPERLDKILERLEKIRGKAYK